MSDLRVIGRLDIKNEHVIKGIQLEGLRKVGKAVEIAIEQYKQGADELLLMDAVASLYGRNNLYHILEEVCKDVFIPITIGGGIRSMKDIEMALKIGADKISLNTTAIRNPDFIKEAVKTYGSQCIVGSIEAKKNLNSWEAYIDNGREETGIDAIEWASTLEDLGVGEILITSVDRDGTKKGFEVNLIEKINSSVNVPVIACSGAGKDEHALELLNATKVSGIAFASILHYKLSTINSIKSTLTEANYSVRT